MVSPKTSVPPSSKNRKKFMSPRRSAPTSPDPEPAAISPEEKSNPEEEKSQPEDPIRVTFRTFDGELLCSNEFHPKQTVFHAAKFVNESTNRDDLFYFESYFMDTDGQLQHHKRLYLEDPISKAVPEGRRDWAILCGNREAGAICDVHMEVLRLQSNADYYSYDFDKKYRYRVHVVTKFDEHNVTLVQPIVSSEELAGRKQKWFAFDVLAVGGCVPKMRARAFDKTRQTDEAGVPLKKKDEYEFETEKKFTLREVAQSAASCVSGKFHMFLNNCQFFSYRFLVELGLQREARTMRVISRKLYNKESAKRYFEMNTFAVEGRDTANLKGGCLDVFRRHPPPKRVYADYLVHVVTHKVPHGVARAVTHGVPHLVTHTVPHAATRLATYPKTVYKKRKARRAEIKKSLHARPPLPKG